MSVRAVEEGDSESMREMIWYSDNPQRDGGDRLCLEEAFCLLEKTQPWTLGTSPLMREVQSPPSEDPHSVGGGECL